jgi:hypothetical protein
MGRAAADRSRSLYDWRLVAADTRATYRQLVASTLAGAVTDGAASHASSTGAGVPA